MKIPAGFAPRPLLTFNFFNIHQTQRFLLITAQISKIFLIPPHISFLFTFNMPTLSYLPHISFLLTFNFSPFYIPPINIHQTPRFLLITAQISKIFLGASPPDPSYLLPVYIQLLPLIYPFYQYSPDPKISPHYSANIKNFLGGFAPRVQTTSDILPAYIQLCPQTPS